MHNFDSMYNVSLCTLKCVVECNNKKAWPAITQYIPLYKINTMRSWWLEIMPFHVHMNHVYSTISMRAPQSNIPFNRKSKNV